MATGTIPPEMPPAAPEPSAPGETAQLDRYIEAQIQKTRRQVKGVELASSLLVLGVGLLAYALLVAVVDSWLVPGGLPIAGRLIAFAVLVVGLGAYLALRVAPLLARRVNPVYAAQAIEEGHPTLKNSLINFLLLRGQRARIPAPVYDAIERRAASDLNKVPVDSAVDRSPVIRIGYILLGVVILFCLYSLLSPKSPLRTFRRVLFPWSRVAAPTRVMIGDVQPGSVRTFVGDSLTVSALVRGVRTDEPVILYFTTADGQSVDQPIAMRVPADGYRHQAVLPAAGGLQQTLDYRIAAGDAAAGPFHVEVLAAPAILVEQVRYEFPPHTGLAPRIVQRQGDLKGIEGTQVTLTARTNVDMKSAYVDLNCDGSRDIELVGDARRAEGTFELRLSPEQKAVYSTYQLRFTDNNKQLNPQPIRYQIEVLPDQSPEIEITAPGVDNYELPLNGAVAIAVRAADRDFGLRRVSLHFECDGKRLNTIELLSQPHAGPFSGAHVFEPARLLGASLQVGDIVQYWAEARDNRAPTANHVQTVKYRLKIVNQVDDKTRDEQLAAAQEKAKEAEKESQSPAADETSREPAADEPAALPQNDEPAAADEGKAADRPDEPAAPDDSAQSRPDPEQDAAEAMERIVKHQQQQAQPPDEATGEQRQPDTSQQSGDQQQPDQGDATSGDAPQQQPGTQQQESPDKSGASGQGESGEKSGDQQSSEPNGQPGDQSGTAEADPAGDQQPGKAQRGPAEQGPAQAGEKQPGGQPSGQPADGGEKSGQQPAQGPSEKQGPARPGAEKQGPDEPGAVEPEPGAEKAATPRDNQQGPNQKRPVTEPSGDQPSGDKQPGDGDRTTDSGKPESKKPRTGAKPPEKTPTGGSRERATGDSGAGQSSKQPNPSPAPQAGNRPRGTKRQQPAGQQGDEKKSDEASSPSVDPKQSDSQGGEKGDSSGGGKEGGGQKANQPGTGGPGQNTPSDEGSGASNEPGTGESKEGAGSKESDSRTGQQGGKQSGEGSTSKAGSGQSPEGGPAGEQSGGQPQEEESQQQGKGGQSGGAGRQGQPSSQAGQSGDGGAAPAETDAQAGNAAGARDDGRAGDREGSDVGGGRSGEDSDQSQDTSEPAGTRPDPLNRQHAQQATDLVLESLKDQLAKEKVDPELLEKLQWSREDVQKFIERWEQLKRDAARQGPAGDEARRLLDQTWERLGPDRRGLTIQAREGEADKLRQLREGRVAKPPAEYREQFEAYTEGATRRGGK